MHTRLSNRCGLSTLELVFALPILLFVMALMINFGTAACWKIRTLVVARQVLWDYRSEHSGPTNPQPKYWPASGSTGNSEEHAESLDDLRLVQPLVRGPLIGAKVNDELLDPKRGLQGASADLTRQYTLLRRMGTYDVTSQSELLDDHWTWSQMGLWNNGHWRIPAIYTLRKTSPSLVEAYVNAVMAILYAPFREALWPLDQDDEFIGYKNIFGWPGPPPDFHPRLYRFCCLDQEVADHRVKGLIHRIQGKVERDADGNVIGRVHQVAENMARAFIELYEKVIWGIQHPESANPPLTPDQIASLQGRLPELQENIVHLEEFLLLLINND